VATISGTVDADLLAGGPENNTLIGGLGNDTLQGGDGADVAVYAGARSRYVVTPDGFGGFYVRDTIADVALNEGQDRLTGIEQLQFTDGLFTPATTATGAALVSAGAGTSLIGAGGLDTLTSATGVDTLVGGGGNDTYFVNDAGDVVVELVNGGFDTVRTALSYYVMPANTDQLIYTGSGSFYGVSNSTGNVVLHGSLGATTLVGGTGNDTFIIKNSNTTIIVPVNAGTYTISTNLSYKMPEGVLNAYIFGNGLGNNLTVIGNSMNNTFIADAGSQQLNGGAGNDTITSGGGSDIYIFDGPASGNDVINGWNTASKVRLSADFGLTDFSLVSSKLSQIGSDVLLSLNTDSTVLFKNTTLSAFTAANFQLPIDLSGLTLTFSDEFDTLSLTDGLSGKWSTTYGFNGAGQLSRHTLQGTGEKQFYVDPDYAGTGTTPLGLNPFSINDGVLSITAGAVPTDMKQFLFNYNYYSGLLTSEPSAIQTYGFYEIRAQLPTNAGTWPAFWLIPASGSNPPEIDILEAAGSNPNNPKQVAHDVGISGGKVGNLTYIPGAGTGFHTYGLLWTPQTLTWYIDGVAVFQIATPADMNQPMYMVVNLALGGIDPNINAATISDSSYKIDYVRSYAIPGVTVGDFTSVVMTGSTSYSETYVGTTGDDIISGAPGAVNGKMKILDGRNGIDTVIYDKTLASYSIYSDDSDGFFVIAKSGGSTHLNGIERVKFSDTAVLDPRTLFTGKYIQGSTTFDVLYGGTGNDQIFGYDGADYIFGREGDDTINGGTGNDVMDGGDGVDTAFYTSAAGTYTIYGDGAGGFYVRANSSGEGFDRLIGFEKISFAGIVSNLPASPTALWLQGGAAAETLTGGTGADVLIGAGGNDELDGGAGSDTANYARAQATYIVYGDGADGFYVQDTAVSGNEGLDHLVNIESLQFSATKVTPAAAMSGLMLRGTAAADLLTGSTGGDVLTGNLGDDSLDGGTGTDVATYAGPRAQYAVFTGTDGAYYVLDTLAGAANEGLDRLVNIENIRFSDATVALSAATGGTAAIGTSAADSLIGAASNDLFIGGAGDDTLVGGDGNDVAVYSGARARYTITVDGSGGYFIQDELTGLTNEGRDRISGIETLRFSDGTVSTSAVAVAGASLLGGDASDSLVGGSANDTLDGAWGPDTMVGGGGDDLYYIENAGDVVVEAVGGGYDTVITARAWTATAGSEIEYVVLTGTAPLNMTGNLYSMVLEANAGINTLDDGGGADLLKGMGGNDVYIVRNAGTAVVEAAGQGTDLVRTALGAYTLTDNVENLTYTGTGNFSATGNTLVNVITAGTGNDTLNGGAGGDRLIGGLGNDTYVVDNASDVIVENAGEGYDTQVTSLVSAIAAANIEALTYGGTANFTGYANAAGTAVTGGIGADKLIGGVGKDTLDGGIGADTLTGGGGDDVFIVDNVGDRITEAASGGTDTVRTNLGSYTLGTELETLVYTGGATFAGTGNSLANLITGGANADTLLGGGGNDTLDGGFGSDSLDGGAGTDTAVYAGATARYVVTSDGLGGFYVQDTLSSAVDYLFNMEAVQFSDGLVSLNGPLPGVSLVGTAAADTLTGTTSGDTLDGGAGIDSLVGGSGDDLYILDNSADVVIETVGGGSDTVQTSRSWVATAGSEIERVILTGTASLNLTGNLFAMALEGNSAINTLDDGGGAGVLKAFAGNDTYVVRNAATTVIEAAGEGTDLVRTTLGSFTLGNNLENLTYFGSGTFAATGNSLGNVITGGAGNDTLDGGLGADRLIGGLGNDTYFTDSASDAVVENAGEGFDTQITTLNSALASANIEALTFNGVGNFVGYANATGTAITGGAGTDTLVGGAGIDILNGGAGNDTLTGGGGADVFHFANLGQGVDRISDFQVGVDHIGLQATAFGIVSLADVMFVSGVAPQPTSSQATLLYDTGTGALFYDANGGDGSDKVQIATLGNKAAISLSDFWLV